MMVCIAVRLVFMFCYIMVFGFVSSVVECGLFLESGSVFCIVSLCSGCIGYYAFL